MNRVSCFDNVSLFRHSFVFLQVEPHVFAFLGISSGHAAILLAVLGCTGQTAKRSLTFVIVVYNIVQKYDVCEPCRVERSLT